MKRQNLSQIQNAFASACQRQSANHRKSASAPPPTQIARHSPHPIEELQSEIGNHAVNQLLAGEPVVQAKPLFRGLSYELTENLQQQSEVSPQASGGGKTMPEAVQQKMETAFGTDFSDVRIHEGKEAESIGAIAYTRRRDIHFAPGKYDPTSRSGQELLGHELTHVMQQEAGRVAVPQGKDLPINADPKLEAEADLLGTKVAQGEPVQVRGSEPGNSLKVPSSAAGSGFIPVQCQKRKGISRIWHAVRHPQRAFRNRQGGQNSSRVNIVRDLSEHYSTSSPASPKPQNTNLMSDQDPKNNSSQLEPDSPELKRHVIAYRKARFYHGVKYPNEIVKETDKTVWQSVQEGGLKTQFSATGATSDPDKQHMSEQVSGKIHLALEIGVGSDYAPSNENVIRPILGPERTRYNVLKNRNTRLVNKIELMADPDQNKAYTTEQDIPPEDILFGKNSDMLKRLNSQVREEADLRKMKLIGEQYDGEKPDPETVIKNHQEALNKGYISD